MWFSCGALHVHNILNYTNHTEAQVGWVVCCCSILSEYSSTPENKAFDSYYV